MFYPDAMYLRALKRSELQRLAREHNVKANLKSEVIIDFLLQRFSEAQARTQVGPPDTQQATAAEVNARPQINVPKSPISIATGSGIHRPTPYAISDVNQESLNAEDIEHRSRIVAALLDDAQSERLGPRHDTTYLDSPPNNSKREDLPAEQSLVEETVNILAEIDRDSEKIIKRIMKLRAATAELRSRTKVVREVVRAEDFNRVRILTYLTYWQPIDHDGWSYHEVWSGKIKIRDPNDFVGVTTSDEEDMDEDNEDNEDMYNNRNAVRVSPRSNSAQSDGSAADRSDSITSVRPPVNVHPEVNGITTVESPSVIPRLGQKRLRNGTEDEDSPVDDLRYRPRRRTDDNDPDTPEREIIKIEADPLEVLGHFSPPSTPTPRRVNLKGKKKMTAEQVQALENERAAEQFLAEILASNPRLQPSAVCMDAREASMTAEQRVCIPSFEHERASTQSGLNRGPDGRLYIQQPFEDAPFTGAQDVPRQEDI
ncbi:hypothetical protein APHAL10511_004783 [Amanita phalloides]|nr:hypothetical protein APHAL10511_004783 [Amanita phalloides]